MKKFLLGTVALVALAAPAAAADLAARPYTKAPPIPVSPVYNWRGFYVGANGGWGSNWNCWDLAALGVVAVNPNLAEGCHDASGGTVGGQVGYRWQATNWVFGLEAQGNWADFKGSNLNLLAGGPFAVATLTDRTKTRSFGLLTGQIGYTWNNVLWYAKGGAAVTNSRYDTFTVANPLVDGATVTRWGGTVGTGIEIGFAPQWSVAFEYDHLFMGTRNVTAVLPTGVISAVDRIRQDIDVGTVRVNYTFGGPVVARY